MCNVESGLRISRKHFDMFAVILPGLKVMDEDYNPRQNMQQLRLTIFPMPAYWQRNESSRLVVEKSPGGWTYACLTNP
jgi:hypothetical protein